MKKYLVIGNPIEHSLSTKIYNYWLNKNKDDNSKIKARACLRIEAQNALRCQKSPRSS